MRVVTSAPATISAVLAAVMGSIPGCIGLDYRRYPGHASLHVTCETDEQVHAVAAAFGLHASIASFASGIAVQWWLAVNSGYDGDLHVEVTGPHHPGPAPIPQIDEAGLAVALTAAQALGEERAA